MAHRPGSYFFTNATVLDGTEDMKPRPGMAVTVEDGKIVAIAPAAFAATPPLARVIDLHGAYLMPGLINMHAHLIGTGMPPGSEGVRATVERADRLPGHLSLERIMRSSAQRQLASGVTTVRGAGDPFLIDITVRDSIEVDRYAGPRILAPGTGLTIQGGHGQGAYAQAVSTPDEAAAAVRELVVSGADVIKLFVTDGMTDGAGPDGAVTVRMPLEVAHAACLAAHRYGKPVMAHAESTEGVRTALLAGADTVEHGAPLDDEALALFRGSAGTQLPGRSPSLTCTLSPALTYVALGAAEAGITPAQRRSAATVFAGIVQGTRQALDAGIQVGIGTDSGCAYVSHYDMWREVVYFQRFTGVSNAFALHTATQVNAQLLGLGDATGTVEVGKDADLIACSHNPLDDLAALRSPRYVMTRGKLVEKLRVKHIDEIDEVADRVMELPPEAVLELCRAEGVEL